MFDLYVSTHLHVSVHDMSLAITHRLCKHMSIYVLSKGMQISSFVAKEGRKDERKDFHSYEDKNHSDPTPTRTKPFGADYAYTFQMF